MRGDAALFVSDECVEAAWSVVDKALHHERPVLPYERGTWGPPEAAKIVADAEGWHDPEIRSGPAMLSAPTPNRSSSCSM